MNIPHCLPPRSYLSVFPNSQTISFANFFYFCVVKGGLAADTPFESDDNQFCQLLLTLQGQRCFGCRSYRLVATTRRINAYAWVVPSRFRATLLSHRRIIAYA